MALRFGRSMPPGDATQPEAIVLGIPYEAGCSWKRGTALAPSRIRELASIVPPFTERGGLIPWQRVLDLGNLPLPDLDRLSADEAFIRLEESLQDFLAPFIPMLSSGTRLFTLGGDHSITSALFSWLNRIMDRPPVKLLYLDAHPDLCDEFQNARHSHACVFARVLDRTGLSPSGILGIGIRSYEASEIAFHDINPHTWIAAADLDGMTAEHVDAMVRDFLGQDPFYLSVDIDVLDPAAAPGTGVLEPGGLTTRQLLRILEPTIQSHSLVGFDLVEVSPPLDEGDRTSLTALKILGEALGALRKG
jgi:agmatinase